MGRYLYYNQFILAKSPNIEFFKTRLLEGPDATSFIIGTALYNIILYEILNLNYNLILPCLLVHTLMYEFRIGLNTSGVRSF